MYWLFSFITGINEKSNNVHVKKIFGYKRLLICFFKFNYLHLRTTNKLE